MKQLVNKEFYSLNSGVLEKVFGGATYRIVPYTDTNGKLQFQIIEIN